MSTQSVRRPHEPSIVNPLLNVERLDRLMDEADVDVLVVSSPENVMYITSLFSLSHWFIAGVECYAIVSRANLRLPKLVYPIGDSDLVVECGLAGEALFPYGQFFVLKPHEDVVTTDLHPDDVALGRLAGTGSAPDAATALVEAMHSLEPRPDVVAIEAAGMAPSALDALKRHAETVGARVKDIGRDLVVTSRMVKTKEEIRRLTYAAHVTEDAIAKVVSTLSHGMTEAEAATRFKQYLIEHGVEPRLTVLAFGNHTAFPNAVPGPRKLQEGDIIRFDVGGLFEHYWSDLSRCATFGEPSRRVRDTYDALLAGETACLDAARPGVSAGSVFQAAVEVVRQSGIPDYARQHVGHGIGLNVYDPPILKPGNHVQLEPGMVLNVETPYYEVGFGGLQVEDLILVTESGSTWLTRTNRDLLRAGD